MHTFPLIRVVWGPHGATTGIGPLLTGRLVCTTTGTRMDQVKVLATAFVFRSVKAWTWKNPNHTRNGG